MKTIDSVHFSGSKYQSYFDFWNRYLEHCPDGFEWKQTSEQKDTTPRWCTHEYILDQAAAKNVVQLVHNNPTGAFICLLSTVGIVLQKYTRKEYIIIDSPLFGVDTHEKKYAETVPLLLPIDSSHTVRQALSVVRDTMKECYRYQNFPIQLLHHPTQGQEAYSTNVLVWDESVHQAVKELSRYDFVIGLQKTDASWKVTLQYNPRYFEASFVENFPSHWERTLSYLATLDTKVQDIDIVPPAEKEQLLETYNHTQKTYPVDLTFPQLFEAQVAQTPDATAVVFGDKVLTYVQLNEAANRLATYLREACGVQPNDLVGLFADRSDKMIVALLAILKSGAAFLPLDTSLPKERVAYILANSGTPVLLTEASYDGAFPDFTGTRILLEELSALPEHTANPEPVSTAHDLAYVIYTSGSTGNPKGVELRLRNFSHYLLWANDYYFDNQPGIIFPLFTSISFDLTLTCIFTTLLRGDQLQVYGHQEVSEILLDIFREDTQINAVKLTPSHISMVGHLPLKQTNIQHLITGGETLTLPQVAALQKLNPAMRIYNEYGPTEATVGCTVKLVQHVDDLVSIGTPIANTRIYILDEEQTLLPAGITGEICIGGWGVAKGYLNRQDLTEQKFVPNPFHPETGEWMYRTGDLGRWLPDGEIAFLGRKDFQVKIRGYRIELGEIEAALLQYEGINDAAVLVKQTSDGSPYLTGYFVSQQEVDLVALRKMLAIRLPEYMIPAFFVPMPLFPLTPNGKVNRNALPEPNLQQAVASTAYLAPVTAMEKKLVDIFEKVLGRQEIGVEDDFFSLGGDSIKSIQIASHLYSAGLQAEVRDIIQHPTVRELALRVQIRERLADQSLVAGYVPLTPIQSAFFAQNRKSPHHFNFALLFQTSETFDPGMVEAIFTKIQQHHDALRMTFWEENGQIVQQNHGSDYPFSLQVTDLTQDSSPKETLEIAINALQASIDLAQGPMLKIGLYRMPDGERLCLVVHHLIMDVVSWRILFEDIKTLFEQYHRNEPLQLPFKTDSFLTWATTLSQYANSPAFLVEKEYWHNILHTPVPVIRKDREDEANQVLDSKKASFTWSESQTELLLTKVNQFFQTEINDLLLTALGHSLQQVFGHSEICVEMEGHGREEVLKEVSVHRTVGYFTTTYPVIFSLKAERGLDAQVQIVKQTLRQVPNKGIGYGVLKYLTHADQKADINFSLKPQVCFNYFGQLDEDIQNLPFAFAKECTGDNQDSRELREHDFYITGIIESKQFTLTIDYNRNHYTPETIQKLLLHFEEALDAIVFLAVGSTQYGRLL